jgi:hypothetical protein
MQTPNYARSPLSILTTNISEFFYDSQPSIKNVTFPRNGFHNSTEPESIDATCLPNLTRVAATLPWLPCLIAGRPVSKVVTAPIPKLKIDYSYLHPKLGLLLASVFFSLIHFTMTTTRLGTFSKNQEVC